MLIPTKDDASARRSWKGGLRLRLVVTVIATVAALAMVTTPAGAAQAAAARVGVARASLTSSKHAGAVAKPAACRQSKRRYKYNIVVESSLNYDVTLKPRADGYGNSGVWGFDQTYTMADRDAVVRVDRMLGNCAGALGIAYLPPPGGKDLFDLGVANFNFQYHSEVKPAYPPDSPHHDDAPPPPCAYSYSDMSFTQVRGAPLLASWGRGLRFGFSSMIAPDLATDVVKAISDKLESSCDPFHSSVGPGGVNANSAVAKGVEFRAPSAAGEATALVTMVRRHSSKLRYPVNRIARGKNFELDSGTHTKKDRVGDEETDKSTWRTQIRFTRRAR